MLYVINASEDKALEFYRSTVSSEGQGKIFRWYEFVYMLDLRQKLSNKYESICVINMAPFFKDMEDKYEADMIGSDVTMCIKIFEVCKKDVYLINPAPITVENYGLGWICDLDRHKVIELDDSVK